MCVLCGVILLKIKMLNNHDDAGKIAKKLARE